MLCQSRLISNPIMVATCSLRNTDPHSLNMKLYWNLSPESVSPVFIKLFYMALEPHKIFWCQSVNLVQVLFFWTDMWLYTRHIWSLESLKHQHLVLLYFSILQCSIKTFALFWMWTFAWFWMRTSYYFVYFFLCAYRSERCSQYKFRISIMIRINEFD